MSKAKAAIGSTQDMRVELWPVSKLVPYSKNARTHSEEQVDEIVRSIQTYGWMNPIIADLKTREIIAGHARLRAAIKMGLTRVPVVEVSHLSPALRRAYVIADNKLALKAGWDFTLLKEEFAELPDLGIDLTLTGFDAAEIAAIEQGWNTDFPHDDSGKGGTDMRARIVVRCDPKDKTDLMEHLRASIAESGIAGVEIE